MTATPAGALTPDDIDALVAAADPLATTPTGHVQRVHDEAAEQLLHRIRARVDTVTAAHLAPAPVRPVARRRRRIRWPVLITPAAAVAVAAVTAVLLTGTGPQPPVPVEGVPRPAMASVSVVAGDPAAAPVFLGELAIAAVAASSPVPGPDQYVYVRSLAASIDVTPVYEGTGPALQLGVRAQEAWISQDPDGAVGLIREDGQDTRLNVELGGGGDPTRYAVLAALPTDPQQLLDQVTATTTADIADPASASFEAIGDLLAGSLAPPQIVAALYQAAALIPGIELVPDAVDAAGRTGTGIALVRDGERREWIFDPVTHTYLGARAYLESDGPWGPAGTLTMLTAVLARGVTSDMGSVPTGADLLD